MNTKILKSFLLVRLTHELGYFFPSISVSFSTWHKSNPVWPSPCQPAAPGDLLVRRSDPRESFASLSPPKAFLASFCLSCAQTWAWWFVIVWLGWRSKPEKLARRESCICQQPRSQALCGWLLSRLTGMRTYVTLPSKPETAWCCFLLILTRNKRDTVIREHRLWMREISGFAFLGSFIYLFFVFFFFFFSLRLITLQYCIGFCHT